MRKIALIFCMVGIISHAGAEVRRVAPSDSPRAALSRPTRTLAQAPEKNIKVGALLGFDGLWGKTATTDVLARGLGYSIGAIGQIPFQENFRATVGVAYQFKRLGKAYDGSGQLQEPSPVKLDQSTRSVGLSGMLSYLIERGQESFAPVWWLDLGGEYLIPLSATQTFSGSTIEFKPKGGATVLLGSTADFRMSPSYDLTVSLHGIYGLSSSGNSSFFGVRLLAGVTLRV